MSVAAEHRWRRYDLATQYEDGLEAAVQAITAGELVVLPTDTVYGIGANANDPRAIQALLDAKHRGKDMPPPVLIAEPAMLRALVSEVTPKVLRTIEAHWPGALTLIMKAQPDLRMDLGQANGTIAVRVPAQEQTRALLRRTGALAVSSANISGQPPATTVDDAIIQLGDSVTVYLDAGPAPGPVASTIVDLATTRIGRIVRAGVISHQDLRIHLPGLVDAPVPGHEAPASGDGSAVGAGNADDEDIPSAPQETEASSPNVTATGGDAEGGKFPNTPGA
ncbi:Sua5/YciO/YrdC/YwlC family protein [Propionibacterium sp. oral taxon 192 str. F0372]|uniref:L-threonylcarbamoyladenylate synthase n=1 Tax=Propionibacterium sp. oral taxon 192 TaxID=671222 RepID=UPI0003532D2C|nr:L-threonylcarbamoyladenylate synthase [Propionibacterium sp. oral taxon 192]EPH02677.1 Sua5/YciO/YrdC/YwlC family protein [Propionibacterium sp. oral taxon 192 str. F0372]